jgi:hypothetical protein
MLVPLTIRAVPLTEREPTLANSREDRDRAEAKFRKALKATWGGKTGGGKQATSQYEVEARLARDKTSRLKSLRLARAAEVKTEDEQAPVTPKAKRSPRSEK